jgi:hypothetical protein
MAAAEGQGFERLVDESLSATVPTLIALRIDDKPGVGPPTAANDLCAGYAFARK